MRGNLFRVRILHLFDKLYKEGERELVMLGVATIGKLHFRSNNGAIVGALKSPQYLPATPFRTETFQPPKDQNNAQVAAIAL